MLGSELDALLLKMGIGIASFAFVSMVAIIAYFIKSLINALKSLEKSVNRLQSKFDVATSEIKHSKELIDGNAKNIDRLRNNWDARTSLAIVQVKTNTKDISALKDKLAQC